MAKDESEDPVRRKAKVKKDTEIVTEEGLHLPVAPDGGWGWAVLAASFLTNFIVDGICYTFDIIYQPLKETFNTDRSETALVGSLLVGMYLIVGRSHNSLPRCP